MENYVFVTVGTTHFDELIQTMTSTEVLNTLVGLGYENLLLQTGRGRCKADVSREDIKAIQYDFKASIGDDLRGACLVISHAGAGSILETLKLKKPLLVVINDSLMDNHQYELAEKMSEEGYLYYCTCQQLNETLANKNFEKLKPFPRVDANIFGDYVKRVMNIT